jgi:hypothetical protein
MVVALAVATSAYAHASDVPDPFAPADSGSVAEGAEAPSPPASNPAADGSPTDSAEKDYQPAVARFEASALLDTIVDSLVGDVYAEGRWRPLSLGTFLSEGWLEPWASAPAGEDGLTPRHGWLGAFNGVFYRLWLTTFGYSNHLGAPLRGNQYVGDYQIFLPFSRRFELSVIVPFVVSNGRPAPGRGYTSQFGDLFVTPRFLLSETPATTQVLAIDIRTPTGTGDTGNGIMALQPRYEWWTNPGGPWVVRGGSGISVTMNTAESPAHLAYLGDLAIGRYFTPHDTPFGDLVLYVASNWSAPLDGTTKTGTHFGIGPGTRFHITDNFFFLHYWEFPLVGPHPYTYLMEFALVKVF